MKKEKKILDKLRLFDKKLEYNKKLIKELEEEDFDSIEYLNKHFKIALIEVFFAMFVVFFLSFNIELGFNNLFMLTLIIFLPLMKTILPLYILEVKSLRNYNNKLIKSMRELIDSPDWRNTFAFILCIIIALLCSILFTFLPFFLMIAIFLFSSFFINYSNDFSFIYVLSFFLTSTVVCSIVIIREMFKERMIPAKKEDYIESKKKLKQKRISELKEKTLIYEKQIMKTIKNDFDTIDGLELIDAYIKKYEFKELNKIIKEQKKDYYLEKTKCSYKEAIKEDLEVMSVITND